MVSPFLPPAPRHFVLTSYSAGLSRMHQTGTAAEVKTSQCFSFNAKPVVGYWQRVDKACNADVSEKHAEYIFIFDVKYYV
jgi:hypothetical protein